MELLKGEGALCFFGNKRLVPKTLGINLLKSAELGNALFLLHDSSRTSLFYVAG